MLPRHASSAILEWDIVALSQPPAPAGEVHSGGFSASVKAPFQPQKQHLLLGGMALMNLTREPPNAPKQQQTTNSHTYVLSEIKYGTLKWKQTHPQGGGGFSK